LRLNHLTHACIEYYFKVRQLTKPAWKRVSEIIENKEFLSLLKTALTEKNDLEKHKKICLMLDFCLAERNEIQKLGVLKFQFTPISLGIFKP
jgi:hypothetical protein